MKKKCDVVGCNKDAVCRTRVKGASLLDSVKVYYYWCEDHIPYGTDDLEVIYYV